MATAKVPTDEVHEYVKRTSTAALKAEAVNKCGKTNAEVDSMSRQELMDTVYDWRKKHPSAPSAAAGHGGPSPAKNPKQPPSKSPPHPHTPPTTPPSAPSSDLNQILAMMLQ